MEARCKTKGDKSTIHGPRLHTMLTYYAQLLMIVKVFNIILHVHTGADPGGGGGPGPLLCVDLRWPPPTLSKILHRH